MAGWAGEMAKRVCGETTAEGPSSNISSNSISASATPTKFNHGDLKRSSVDLSY